MIKINMKRKLLIVACVVIFAVGVAGCLWILLSAPRNEAQIVQDGVVLYQFDLSKTGNQMIDIEYDGRINTIQIENGKIRIIEANCPDHTCVRMGWLKYGALPIVCLPNHLMIEFVNPVEEIDAVVK